MKCFRNALLALLIGCFAPVVIWVVGGVALYQAFHARQGKTLIRAGVKELACSISADCPPGYICVNGYCVPEQAA